MKKYYAYLALFFMISTCGWSSEPRPIMQVALVFPLQILSEYYPVYGLRFNAIYGKNAYLQGLDVGCLNHITNDIKGLQFGGVHKVDGDIAGAQIGLISICAGNVKGFQGGWLTVAKGKMVGSQIAGANHSDEMKGIQIGFYNISKDIRGLQLGIINVTKRLYGVQIGLFNLISTKEKYAFFPIINTSF